MNLDGALWPCERCGQAFAPTAGQQRFCLDATCRRARVRVHWERTKRENKAGRIVKFVPATEDVAERPIVLDVIGFEDLRWALADALEIGSAERDDLARLSTARSFGYTRFL